MHSSCFTRRLYQMMLAGLLLSLGSSLLATDARSYSNSGSGTVVRDAQGNPVLDAHGKPIYEKANASEFSSLQILSCGAGGAAITGLVVLILKCHPNMFMDINPPAGWSYETDGQTYLVLRPPTPITTPVNNLNWSFRTVEADPDMFWVLTLGPNDEVCESGRFRDFGPEVIHYPSLHFEPLVAELPANGTANMDVVLRDTTGLPMPNVPVTVEVINPDRATVSPLSGTTNASGRLTLSVAGKTLGYSKLHVIAQTPGLPNEISSGALFVTTPLPAPHVLFQLQSPTVFSGDTVRANGVVIEARRASGQIDAAMTGEAMRLECVRRPNGEVLCWLIFDNIMICTGSMPPWCPPPLPFPNCPQPIPLLFSTEVRDTLENDAVDAAALKARYRQVVAGVPLAEDIAFADADQSPFTADLDQLISAGGSGGLRLTSFLGLDRNREIVGFLEYNPQSSVGVGAGDASSDATVLCAPNPFRHATGTTLRFAARKNGPLTLDVHDAAGRRVRRLFNDWADGARRSLFWDGTDDGGQRLRPGLYYIRLRDGLGVRSTDVVLVN